MGRFNYSGVAITGGTGRLNSSLGGSVLLKNGVVRNYITPTNPQSELQQLIRAAFAYLTQKWKVQTEADRALWETARHDPYWSVQDPFTGTSRPVSSGKSLFILANFNLLASTDSLGTPSVVTSGPSINEPIDTFDITSVVADASSNTLIATYTQTGANEVLTARVTPAISPGNMRLTSVKSQLRGFTTLGASPATISKTDDYTGQVGEKVFYVIEAINLDSGKKRLVSSGNTLVVA